MPSLGKQKEEKQDEDDYNFQKIIEQSKNIQCSNIVASLTGWDDTAKTGIAFGIINFADNKEKGRNLFVVDFDQSAIPIKTFYNNDPHIICLNPTVFYKTGDKIGEKDSTKTLERTRKYLLDIRNLDPNTVAGIVFDGADILLRHAQYSMMEEELGLDIYSSGKTMGEASKRGEIRRTDWSIRDRKYNNVIDLLKNLPFPVIIITHLKDKKEMRFNDDGIKELVTVDTIVDWGSYTKAQMYQRICCEKVIDEKKKVIEWRATVEKSKGNPALTGKKFIIMEKKTDSDDYIWYGFDWNVFR